MYWLFICNYNKYIAFFDRGFEVLSLVKELMIFYFLDYLLSTHGINLLSSHKPHEWQLHNHVISTHFLCKVVHYLMIMYSVYLRLQCLPSYALTNLYFLRGYWFNCTWIAHKAFEKCERREISYPRHVPLRTLHFNLIPCWQLIPGKIPLIAVGEAFCHWSLIVFSSVVGVRVRFTFSPSVGVDPTTDHQLQTKTKNMPHATGQ